MRTTTQELFTDIDLSNIQNLYRNPGMAQLIEQSLQRRESLLAANGALVAKTGQYTGRSPKDKYIVLDAKTQHNVHWGSVNQPMSPEAFDRLYARLQTYLEGKELFQQDCFAGAAPDFQLPIRVLTQQAWHALFARNLFIPAEDTNGHQPRFTVVFAPEFRADPVIDGTNSETCIVINFERGLVIIAGTMYAGEMKKSVFTILNYLLPERGVLPMHCSANVGAKGDVALFFGLSGTGKTTLSADPSRRLIGDDEHGWSDDGVFNFEGGCYAKCIRLSQANEPQIWNAIRYGTVLENVALDSHTRQLDFDNDSLTENTRAAYPLGYIDNAEIPSVAGHPSTIVFLTADASGVLPPIAKLTPAQAMYHFLSGYTSKLAGTERGLGKEPVPNFSTCFGEPFLPRTPQTYAKMLGEKMRRHGVSVWLVNTGWTGGGYGVGKRMDLPYTRAMVNAALDGSLGRVETREHPVFKVRMPVSCPGVPSALLDPRAQWPDATAYDEAAKKLAARFRENFRRFESGADADVLAAQPEI